MKKNILLLSLLIASNAFAQVSIPKGSIYGGASLSLYSSKNENESKSGNMTITGDPSKNSSWVIMPTASYFVMDNLALGVFIGANGYKEVYTSSPGNPKVVRTNKSSGPSFGLFAQKYWNCANNFYTFLGLGLEFSSEKGTQENKSTFTVNNIETSTTTTTKSENKSMSVPIRAGFAYHVAPKVMILGTFSILSFGSYSNKNNIIGDSYDQKKGTYMGFNLTSANALSIGFLVLLNGKK